MREIVGAAVSTAGFVALLVFVPLQLRVSGPAKATTRWMRTLPRADRNLLVRRVLTGHAIYTARPDPAAADASPDSAHAAAVAAMLASQRWTGWSNVALAAALAGVLLTGAFDDTTRVGAEAGAGAGWLLRLTHSLGWRVYLLALVAFGLAFGVIILRRAAHARRYLASARAAA